jgi:hypothetical protein
MVFKSFCFTCPSLSSSLKPLKEVFLFDEVGLARNVNDLRKKRIASLFKYMYASIKKRLLITELPFYYRINEQLVLTKEKSPVAVYFQNKVQEVKQSKLKVKPYQRQKLKTLI